MLPVGDHPAEKAEAASASPSGARNSRETVPVFKESTQALRTSLTAEPPPESVLELFDDLDELDGLGCMHAV